MDCGTPFCHWGCPLGNYIPEWNDMIFSGYWQRALELLEATNNMPEITGRICPVLCEYACVLGINDDAVTVRENELAIIEHAYDNGLIKPCVPNYRTKKKVAIIGSGPAGLSCAAQLNKVGHRVVVFERSDKIGGILRYGIPDFKLEKWVLDRRIGIWRKEGIKFEANVGVGLDYPGTEILKDFDAVCLACGSSIPRDLNIEGRNLGGIHFAIEYLTQANRVVSKDEIPSDKLISAKGKKVLVIGAGDTGADCVGTAHRQQASCVVQIEILPRPPECRTQEYSWPKYPLLLKNSSSHLEGADRQWCIATKEFEGENGLVKRVRCSRIEFTKSEKDSCSVMKEIPGSEFEIEADLVILAMGFVHTEHRGLVQELGLKLDNRGNILTDDNFMTSRESVFSAGDMRRGQSLVVWAIHEGRKAAHYIDRYLTGNSELPTI
jgi:glutamate synthase (NADPH/NADH) small chain